MLMCVQEFERRENMTHGRTTQRSHARLDCTDRRPVPRHCRIHCLVNTMASTSPTIEACVDPCTAYWILEPALLALILLPASQA